MVDYKGFFDKIDNG